MPKLVLHITHSSSLSGGAPKTLLYLIEGLDRSKYKPIVACIHNVPDILNFYKEHGIDSLYWPGIVVFPHTTGGWFSLFNPIGFAGFFKAFIRFWPSVCSTVKLVRHLGPDIVHLNSLTLVSSGIGVKLTKTKLVWHILESVHSGHLGVRRRILRGLVKHLADRYIFICEQNQLELMGSDQGVIILEQIDYKAFNRLLDGHGVRKALGLPSSSKVVLFLGGMSRLKGAPILLSALHYVKRQIPNMKAIIAGGLSPESRTIKARLGRQLLPLFGKKTERQTFNYLLDKWSMQDYVYLLPFQKEPERLFAAADLVVCPWTRPHFARPVIEAGAMAKPVVASRIGGIEEAVVDGVTGLLVPPNNPVQLGEAIIKVLNDDKLAVSLGENGFIYVSKKYDSKRSTQMIDKVYRSLLN